VLHEQIQHMQVNLPEVTHPQIDLSAIFYLTKNIAGKDLSPLSTTLAGINLPITLYGLDNQDKWHLVNENASTTFKQVACSVQLADRGGPIAKNLLNKFQFAVEDAGLELNAHVEWQGSGDALQRAIELDQFCIEVDQMISVHVAQGEAPIHGTKFKGLAEASGMTLKDDGKFHFYSNDVPLFSAIDTNNVPFTAESLRSNVLKSVTFQIEIPKVSNCEQVFNQMIAIAQKTASSLNASLVDDNQKPLGDLQIEKIRQQLKVIHATMVARGIMPGSPASMRLFN
jgi:ZipA, C-terminal FtsZ-binding domain